MTGNQRAPLALASLACIVLAALSAAVLPTVPSYDPWSWIVWGRELSDPHLSFLIGGGASWKPLPFLFTIVWGLFGGAAPTLWVITARAGGLLGLVLAWRLAAQLTQRAWPGDVDPPDSAQSDRAPDGAQPDRRRATAAAVAGLLSVIAILLTQDWFYYWLRGTSEVILIATSLGTIERLLAGKRLQAFAFAVASSLIRPEWWPFVLLLALWLWFGDPERRQLKMRATLLAGLLVIGFLWFVPPWIGSGNAFLAANIAAQYNGHLGADRLHTVIARGVDLQVLPALIAAALAVAVGWWRERDRLLAALTAGIVAWWIVVVAMTLDGYPGLERFFLPAAALICVLGGVGIVRVALLAGRLKAEWRWPLAAAATMLLVAVSALLSTTRINQARAAGPAAAQAVATLDHLSTVVARVGGHSGVYPCPTSFAAVNHGVQTALAWKLHVTLGRVGVVMNAPGLDFIGPTNGADGGPVPVDPRLTKGQTIAQYAGWRVVRMTDPSHPARNGCVGH